MHMAPVKKKHNNNLAITSETSEDNKSLWFSRPRLNANDEGLKCFVCGEIGTEELRKCAYNKPFKCNVHFHGSCINDYNSGYFDSNVLKELLSTKDLVCPIHYCHICYLERKKNSAVVGGLVECSECYRAFHIDCRPAGVELKEGKIRSRTVKWTKCHSHCSDKPQNKQYHRLRFCCECETKDKLENLIACSLCPRSFHDACATRTAKGYTSPIDKEGKSIEISCDTRFCESCIHGESIRIGQHACVYYEKKYFPAIVVDHSTLPEGVRKMDPRRKNFGKCGNIPVQWGGCTNMFNIMPSTWVINMFPGSKQLFNVDDDPDFVAAWEKYETLEAPRPSIASELHQSDNYEPIETSVCHPSLLGISKHLAEIEEELYECQCKGEDGVIRCINSNTCTNKAVSQECAKSCEEGPGICGNRGIQKKMVNEHTTVELTVNKGRGMFATADISQGTFIAEYAGEIIGNEERNKRTALASQKRNDEENHYMMTLSSNRTIDCKYKGNRARFINHSCDPNCVVAMMSVPFKSFIKKQTAFVKIDSRVGIYAKRKIEKGEELSFDYDMNEYDGCYLPDCYCGTKACRGSLGKSKEDREVGKKKVVNKEGQKKKGVKRKRLSIASQLQGKKAKSCISAVKKDNSVSPSSPKLQFKMNTWRRSRLSISSVALKKEFTNEKENISSCKKRRGRPSKIILNEMNSKRKEEDGSVEDEDIDWKDRIHITDLSTSSRKKRNGKNKVDKLNKTQLKEMPGLSPNFEDKNDELSMEEEAPDSEDSMTPPPSLVAQSRRGRSSHFAK